MTKQMIELCPWTILPALLFASIIQVAYAGFFEPVSERITYQGHLQQGLEPYSGNSLPMTFRLWNDALGGSQSGDDIVLSVEVIDGLFQVELDFGSVFGSEAKWLEIEIDGQILDPRQPITATPLALNALNASSAPLSSRWSVSGGGIHYSGGNVGVGTSVPANRLSVAGNADITGSFAVGTGTGGDRLRVQSESGEAAMRVIVGNTTRFRIYGTGGVGVGSNMNTNPPPAGALAVSGAVGIGINNPDARLHVQEGTSGTGLILPGLRVFQNTESPNVVGGSSSNVVEPGVSGATIGGGGSEVVWHTISADYATIGGGIDNSATGESATVSGGNDNIASGLSATVSGGQQNFATNSWATVGGGNFNAATGQYATVPGGRDNAAAGTYSFAAGRRAKADHQGSFVLADSTNADISSNQANRFQARFSNGYRLFTNANASLGVQALANATSWSSISDRNVKRNIVPVDPVDVAQRLASIPISWWNYIDDSANVQHMGPMAQDFHAAFGLGASETHIATLDADGVALAAIQGVYLLVQKKDAEIAALHRRNDELEDRLMQLEQLLYSMSGTAQPRP